LINEFVSIQLQHSAKTHPQYPDSRLFCCVFSQIFFDCL